MASANGYPAGPGHVQLIPGPLYHTNGFTAFSHLLAGNHVVLLSRFDPGRMLDAIGRYGATLASHHDPLCELVRTACTNGRPS